MGEAKRREQEIRPKKDARFFSGPVETPVGWLWVYSNGHVHRLTIGARITNPATVNVAQEIAGSPHDFPVAVPAEGQG